MSSKDLKKKWTKSSSLLGNESRVGTESSVHFNFLSNTVLDTNFTFLYAQIFEIILNVIKIGGYDSSRPECCKKFQYHEDRWEYAVVGK